MCTVLSKFIVSNNYTTKSFLQFLKKRLKGCQIAKITEVHLIIINQKLV